MEGQINIPAEDTKKELEVINDFDLLSEPMSHGPSVPLDVESAVDEAVLIRSAMPVKFVLVRD